MTVASVIALLPVLLLLILIWTKLSGHAIDPLALFCYLFTFYYVFRDVLITFGWDTAYPDLYFFPGQTAQLLPRASIALTLFLAALVSGYLVFAPAAQALVRLVPVARTEPSTRRVGRLVVWLTVATSLVSLGLLARYGGVAGVIRAGKVSKSLAGMYELRIFPSVGAVAASALALALWHEGRELGTRRTGRALLALGAALFNAACVMLWGSRQGVAVVIAILITGQWLLGRRSGRGRESHGRRPGYARVLTLTLVLLVAIFGLRVARDTVLRGHVSRPILGQSALRQLSVATNSTYFDAMLLGLRDWPHVYPYRGGQDFEIGIEAMVPRALWPGKPAKVTPGTWFRQLYEPQFVNGWPLGAVGDWYVNFGLPGVVFGGLLSGIVYSALMAAWRRAAWTAFNVAAMTCVVMWVVPTGFEALTPLRWAQWALPLILCTWFVAGRARTSRRPALAPGPRLEHDPAS